MFYQSRFHLIYFPSNLKHKHVRMFIFPRSELRACSQRKPVLGPFCPYFFSQGGFLSKGLCRRTPRKLPFLSVHPLNFECSLSRDLLYVLSNRSSLNRSLSFGKVSVELRKLLFSLLL